MAPGRIAVGIRQGTIMLDQAFERFPGQIEAIETRIAALQAGDHRERLGIMVEAAMGSEALVERTLAGMAERRMAEVMGQRTGFRQVLVEAESARDRSGDLGDFERMGEPGAIMIAFMEHEYLGQIGR